MLKFIKKLILFFILISFILCGMFFYFYKTGGDDLTAPAFSNSLSFNEKIDFIRDKDLSRIEYIAIGSSMTLNNVDSEIMVRHLGENYINLGSWGFKISDSERFLKEMSGFFPNLKTVIISTTFVDFSSTTRNIQVDYDLIRLSVKHKLGMIPYLMNLDLRYMLNNSKTNKAKIRDSGSYDILSFDEYGGVILKIPEEAINPERWNNDITNFEVSEKELSALNELKDFLKSRNIKTVITVPPQREGLMNEEKLKLVNNEISRIQKVVLSGGGIFINSFELGVWPDSLFVDYCHLNKAGAVKYTEIVAGLIFPP
jgi:hypothetical protein